MTPLPDDFPKALVYGLAVAGKSTVRALLRHGYDVIVADDSITPERCEAICAGLAAKGFVPTCIFGIGSYTYQYNTRDTFGFAMKATAGIIDGELREIYKDPKTGNGLKKSARGLLAVGREADGELLLEEQTTWERVRDCAFEQVFVDGKLVRDQTLSEIRAILKDGS